MRLDCKCLGHFAICQDFSEICLISPVKYIIYTFIIYLMLWFFFFNITKYTFYYSFCTFLKMLFGPNINLRFSVLYNKISTICNGFHVSFIREKNRIIEAASRVRGYLKTSHLMDCFRVVRTRYAYSTRIRNLT